MKFLIDDVSYSIYRYNSVSILRYGVFRHGDFLRYVKIHMTENIIENDVLYTNNYIPEGEYLHLKESSHSELGHITTLPNVEH